MDSYRSIERCLVWRTGALSMTKTCRVGKEEWSSWLSALRTQRRPLLPHHSRLPRKAELSAEGRPLRTSSSSGLNISAPCGERRWTWYPKPASHYSLGIQSGRRPVWARPTTMAAMTTFIPTTMAAVFQVHLDLVDFSEITSQPS